jgi:hypothetical protein
MIAATPQPRAKAFMEAAVEQHVFLHMRRGLFEFTSSLNLGFAAIFAWYAYCFYAGGDIRLDGVHRRFVLGAYWINDHLSNDQRAVEGVELFFIFCIVVATLAFFILVRFVFTIIPAWRLLPVVGGVIAFAAPAIAWWIALHRVVEMRAASTSPPYPISSAILMSVALIFALLRVNKLKPIPLLRSLLVLSLNYAVLGWYVWPLTSGFQIHSPMFFSLAWPAAGITWISYINGLRRSAALVE